ncbi:MAG: LacI family DNA-binding transcriptional regulator [Chloroflexota bacterium]
MTTINKIAQLAGVSPATVSKVLNNRPYVSAEKRALIERIISETGYVPSQRARGLSTKQSSILGLLIPYTPDQLFTDPHLLECMRGIENEANSHGYKMLLSTVHAPVDAANTCADLLRSDVIDGAIVLETLDLRVFANSFGERHSPLIVIGYPQDHSIPTVHADDYGGALKATRYMLELGHRRIGIVSSLPRPFALEERLRGIIDAHIACDVVQDEQLFAMGDMSVESGEEAGRLLLSRSAPPTAIFALNDRMAIGVMRAAQAQGLHIPADLSIMGFDDIPLAGLLTPALSTVRQPGRAMGTAAAQALFAMLADQTPEPINVINTDIVIRGSTAGPSQKGGTR